MSGVHGIIACAGNGTRFAESVGKPNPYPKHLESFGRKTVLQRALEGMVSNMAPDKVTFTLNPRLQDLYIQHIRGLQDVYPGIEMSFAPAIEEEGVALFGNIKRTLSPGIWGVDGQKREFSGRVLAIGLGDSVVTPSPDSSLKRDVHANLDLLEKESFAVFRDVNEGGLIYWVSGFEELGDSATPPKHRRGGKEYGLKWFNCNTIQELQRAERELGVVGFDQEIPRNGRKESF